MIEYNITVPISLTKDEVKFLNDLWETLQSPNDTSKDANYIQLLKVEPKDHLIEYEHIWYNNVDAILQQSDKFQMLYNLSKNDIFLDFDYCDIHGIYTFYPTKFFKLHYKPVKL